MSNTMAIITFFAKGRAASSGMGVSTVGALGTCGDSILRDIGEG